MIHTSTDESALFQDYDETNVPLRNLFFLFENAAL
jgi:hypothetical protein